MGRSDRLRRALGIVAVLAVARLALHCGGTEAVPCKSTGECPAGQYCPVTTMGGVGSAIPDCSGAASEPICQAYGKPGDECTTPGVPPDLQCAGGLTCNAGMGGRPLAAGPGGQCAELQPSGGTCGANADCQGATLPGGPVCNKALGVCGPPGQGKEGDPCSIERACGPDLTCAGAAAAQLDATGFCSRAFPAGASCAQAPDACADGLSCVSGVCSGP